MPPSISTCTAAYLNEQLVKLQLITVQSKKECFINDMQFRGCKDEIGCVSLVF
jgi:hypothetical protein